MATSSEPNVVGINTAGVSKIIDANNSYKNALVNLTNIAATKTEIQRAIKGSSVEAQALSLFTTIDAQVTAFYKTLDTFNDKISTLAGNYAKHDASSTVISDVIKSIKKS